MNTSTIELSICITLKNRSAVKLKSGKVLHLFPNCIDTIVESVSTMEGVEVIISDWESTDWPPEDWIGKSLKNIPFKLIRAKGHFHRGSGRNIAASHASGNYLLFLDADMLLTRDVILNGLDKVKNNIAYYPICFYFLDPAHETGFWCGGGRGIVMLTKEMFFKAGQWPCPPTYSRAFDEDQVFHKKLQASGIKFVVQKEVNFFHQYHPGRSVDTILTRRRFLIENAAQIEI